VIGEFDIYGVYFPAFAVFAAIAFLLLIAIKRPLDAIGFYRLSRWSAQPSYRGHSIVDGDSRMIEP
jgi:Protein of unknown function (DUF1656)